MALISWKQFARSRWLPWSLVAVLVVSGGFGGARLVETEEELKVSIKATEEYRKQVERTRYELAQTEWQLQQERSKATKKTRQETRPDGTVIVEKEETDEKTTTESAGTSTKKTSETEKIDTEETRTLEEESSQRLRREVGGQSDYQVGGGISTDIQLDYSYDLLGGVRLGGLPIWLFPRLELNGTTYIPRRFGLGVTVEF